MPSIPTSYRTRTRVRRSSIFWLVSNESYRCGSTKSAPLTQDENLESIIDSCESENGVIGAVQTYPGPRKGAATFKALTYNQWLLVGRKTFESMGALPNRKYAVVTRSGWTSNDDNVVVFQSIEEAMDS
ncbi:dihydrofolate reductase [Salmonella enterica]|uniref:dihydrofolate reductase n=1 Tax=Salmonella enterica TaxID=28901 RepID=UPI0023DD167C|nr:dihydrofolate reductase [Salmonella enterica]